MVPCAGGRCVEQGHHFRIVVPAVAEPLPDVHPVLLLDVRAVVLLVRPAAGELDWRFPLLAPVERVPVEELAAIVAVQPCSAKGSLVLMSWSYSSVPDPPGRNARSVCP